MKARFTTATFRKQRWSLIGIVASLLVSRPHWHDISMGVRLIEDRSVASISW